MERSNPVVELDPTGLAGDDLSGIGSGGFTIGQGGGPYPPIVAPPPITPSEAERQKMIDLARRWNQGSPSWLPSNQCYDQAKALGRYLNGQGPWQYCTPQVIGGAWGPLNHNVLAINPVTGNSDPAFTLDPYHGPFCWNLDRDITVSTPGDFRSSWPGPVRQSGTPSK
jgi:hypothetical protein